ncbi:hypothetical protein pipiens_003583 [Culex pipiens pipiens]|uniref:Uncharacterized protein n=1 Tax=Culex pipiens pipiens TaxID=38569 RepID=A0ABD1CWG9_CULPP
MAKHHQHQHHHQNINRSPRLSYLTSHSQSQSFMSESGEMTEMMDLESENLLGERYGSAIQVISGSSYNGSGGLLAASAGNGSDLLLGTSAATRVAALNYQQQLQILQQQQQQLQQAQQLEELGIGFAEGSFNSKLLSPAVTIVEMTAGGLLPNSGNMRQKNMKAKSAVAAAMAASGAEQANLNAIGLQLSVDRGGPQEWGEATRSYVKAQRRHAGRATFQGQVYNFLERPAGYKCFIYHVSV